MVLEKLNEIPGVIANVPEGAFYVFPDISAFFGLSFKDYKINDANDLSLYLLSEANVALVTGQHLVHLNVFVYLTLQVMKS